MRRRFLLTACLLPSCLHAQWTVQDSHSTASLRGIAYVGNGVAWASGSGGTVLRTLDLGKTWTKCAVPEGAEKLDFRGVQAFDAQTAIVMSSGPGDLSRLYKTVDGCGTWKLVFTNPDKEGFWDAVFGRAGRGVLIGDPVDKRFVIFGSSDGQYEEWQRIGERSDLSHFRIDFEPYDGEGLFAASNSALQGDPVTGVAFATGGPQGAFFGKAIWRSAGTGGYPVASTVKSRIPLSQGVGAGAFSFATKDALALKFTGRYVAVGGDYTKPDVTTGTAAYSHDGGAHWAPAASTPHGYRSAVAYSETLKAWITVGPNGTDVSFDDGRDWRALRPLAGDAADADRGWNALSLPFVVGEKGRIGVLRDGAVDSVRKN